VDVRISHPSLHVYASPLPLYTRESLVEDIKSQIDLSLSDCQRRDETDGTRSTINEEETSLEAFLDALVTLLGSIVLCPGFHEINTDHEALPPDVADERMTFLEFDQSLFEVNPHARTILEDTLFQLIEYFQCRLAGDGISPEGRCVRSMFEAICNFCFCDGGSEGKTIRNPLCHGSDVWFHSVVFHAEHLPRASGTGLHFVCDEEDPIFCADIPEASHEFGRGDEVASFPLNGFDEDGGDFFRGEFPLKVSLEVFLEDLKSPSSIGVGVGEAMDIEELSAESLPLYGFAGGEGEGCPCSSMKCPLEADEFVSPGRMARELDRTLDRFGSGIAEKNFLRRFSGSELCKALTETTVGDIVKIRSGEVEEFIHLVVNCSANCRMCVAQIIHRDPRRKVDVAIAVNVPHKTSPPVTCEKWVDLCEGWEDIFFLTFEFCECFGSGRRSDDAGDESAFLRFYCVRCR